MLRPFAHPVACCCVFLGVVRQSLRLRACWQWCANGCNNSQECWDLQCIVGRIQPMSLCKPCVMNVRGPNNVARAVKRIQHCCTTLWRSRNKRNVASFWLKSLTGFKLCATTRNNMQQGVQTDATCNIPNNVGSSWSTMLRPFSRSLRLEKKNYR